MRVPASLLGRGKRLAKGPQTKLKTIDHEMMMMMMMMTINPRTTERQMVSQ